MHERKVERALAGDRLLDECRRRSKPAQARFGMDPGEQLGHEPRMGKLLVAIERDVVDRLPVQDGADLDEPGEIGVKLAREFELENQVGA